MGCDIHIVLERRDMVRDCWVGLREIGYLDKRPLNLHVGVSPEEQHQWKVSPPLNFIAHKLKSRDYNFFYGLAGVRDGDEPAGVSNGLPDDQSTLSTLVLTNNSDLHSHGHVTLRQLLPILAQRKNGLPWSDKLAAMVHDDRVTTKLQTGIDPNDLILEWIDDIKWEDIDDYRIVFAFDN